MYNKAAFIPVMDYYSDLQGNKIMMYSTWMNLENIMLCEIYQEKR